MTIESSRHFLTPEDRIAYRAEKAFKESVTKEMPTQIEVIVLSDARNPNTSNEQDENGYAFFRARSLSGHHDMLTNPYELQDNSEVRKAVNAHPQAYFALQQDGEIPGGGDVWSAMIEGGVIRLISLIEKNKYRFKANGSGSRSYFQNGRKQQNKKKTKPVTKKLKKPVTKFTPLPETTPEDKAIFDLVAKQESNYSYNAANIIWYPNGKGGVHKLNNPPIYDGKFNNKKIEELTFGEIMKAQYAYFVKRYPTKRPENSFFAMGRYQVIPETMMTVRSALKLKDTDIYSKQTQDQIMEWLIYGGKKRPYLSAYLLGSEEVNVNEALIGLAREFSSIPTPNGSSYYGNEKALHEPEEVKKVLIAAREANIKNGRTIE